MTLKERKEITRLRAKGTYTYKEAKKLIDYYNKYQYKIFQCKT